MASFCRPLACKLRHACCAPYIHLQLWHASVCMLSNGRKHVFAALDGGCPCCSMLNELVSFRQSKRARVRAHRGCMHALVIMLSPKSLLHLADQLVTLMHLHPDFRGTSDTCTSTRSFATPDHTHAYAYLRNLITHDAMHTPDTYSSNRHHFLLPASTHEAQLYTITSP